MNEKDAFLKRLNAEVATTLRVLRAYPAGKDDLKPQGDKLRTARELAWVFVAEQALSNAAIRGALDLSGFPQISGTLAEIIARYEKEAAETAKKVQAMSDAEWEGTMDFFVGPNKMDKIRRADVLWLTLNDMIHHRGQFSIYLRMAGGKVPSIYGPSGDEPWM